VPASFWQMEQIGGPSIWLHCAANFWLYIKSVRQSMAFFFSPELTLAFFENKLSMSFSTMPSCLISSWYFVAICGLMV
jgi:hypothetical protein